MVEKETFTTTNNDTGTQLPDLYLILQLALYDMTHYRGVSKTLMNS